MSSAAATPEVAGLGETEDKSFWEEYLKKVTDEDIRLIIRWQKTLDTLLVYVGLFIGVLTAFIIQVSSMIQPSPGDATNKLLIAIYNHTMNASTPIDLQQYITWDESFNSTVTSSVFVLYISLGISITEAALALIISVWLTRYQRSLTGTGPTCIHERIRLRHENYRGLMEWRLPILIDILPMVALVALLLFALFISRFTWSAHPMTGVTLSNIFIGTAVFFVATASLAAFIPGAPFHSPFSSFIRFIFQIFPNQSICGLIRIRTVCVALLYVFSHVVFFKTRIPGIIGILIQFLVGVSLHSLCQGIQAKNDTQKQPKPSIFSLPTWLCIQGIIITALSFTLAQMRTLGLVLVLLFLKDIVLVVGTISTMRMLRQLPDAGKAKVEAVAWMIKTQPSHDLVTTFRNAVEIARNCANLRSTFLEEILPVLDAVIKSIRGDREQDLKDEERLCITLLAVLVDFEPCEASFWRNEAAMKRPVLSDGLKEKLRNLCKGCAGHNSQPMSGCAKAEAEFILGKVVSILERESARVVCC